MGKYDYREEKIRRLDKEWLKYYILIDITMHYGLDFGNKKGKATRLRINIGATDKSIYQKEKYRGKFLAQMEKATIKEKIDLDKLKEEIDERFIRSKIDGDPYDWHEYAREIKKDPKESVDKYVFLYFNYMKEAEKEKRYLAEDKKRDAEKEAKEKEEEQKRNTGSYQYSNTGREKPHNSSYAAPKYTSNAQPQEKPQRSSYAAPKYTSNAKPQEKPKRVKHYTAESCFEMIREILNRTITEEAKYEKKIELSDEEVEELVEAFYRKKKRELPEVEVLYVEKYTDIINKLLTMNRTAMIYEKITRGRLKNDGIPSITDVADLAINCYDIAVKNLTTLDFHFGSDFEDKTYFTKMLKDLNIEKSLEVYEKVYNTYMKYYNSLTAEEKESQIKYLSYEYQYKRLFGQNNRLVTPKELKDRVNKTIKDQLIDDYTPIDNNNSLEYEQRIRKATSLMSVEEIIRLYNAIKEEYYERSHPTRRNYYTQISEETKERYKQATKLLQECFVNVLRTKIGYRTDFGNKTEEQEKEELEKLRIQEATVCLDLLEEEPLFIDREYIEKAKTGDAKKRSELLQETKNASDRFYGMDKVRQTVSKATGAYRKLMRLKQLEKMTTTKEVEEALEAAKKLF